MALGVKQMQNSIPGDRREYVIDVTMDGSYPAGGYPLTPALLGVASIDTLAMGSMRAGLAWEWDHVNNKLKAYKVGAAGPMVEAAAADVSAAVTLRVLVRSK